MSIYQTVLKRVFDVASSGAALGVLSPLLAAVSLAIRLEDGGPALFRQVRVGQNDEPFEIYKFRSMPVDTENVSSDKATRVTITRIGAVIRRTNIDELPQLINILKGDMSVVGPRPAIPAQQRLCQLRRGSGAHRLKPGLTGLAQVNSYDGMPEDEKAEWDSRYAKGISLFGDLSLILRTVTYIMNRPPVY